MKLRLLRFLLCPVCRRPDLALEMRSAAGAGGALEIVEGLLRCACGRRYPITNGIPRMLPDSMQESGGAAQDRGGDRHADRHTAEFRRLHKATQESFGFQWLRYEVTDNAENTRFFQDAIPFAGESLRGAMTLDAGCGMGRFMEVAAAAGAEVVGMDLSRAVDRAWASTRYPENVHLVQGDLMRPPLRASSFDYIYSIGVLHHTPDTRQSFDSLCGLLKPRGRIGIWVYRTIQPELPVGLHKRAFALLTQLCSDGARTVTTRLPHRLLHCLCYTAAPLGWLKRAAAENAAVKPVLFPFLLLPVSAHRRWRVRLCDTFDWLSPRYQWKHTTAEVIGWFQDAGLTDICAARRPVSVSGMKNAAGAAYRDARQPAAGRLQERAGNG